MNRLNAREMLGIWEAGMHYPAIERSLYLLGALYGTDPETMGRLSIGERDARLLSFREWIFGPRLMNVSQCPKCKTTIEWETDIRDLRLQPVETGEGLKTLRMEEEGYRVDFRLPNSFDVMEAMHNRQNGMGTEGLLSGCILKIQKEDTENPGELPPRLMAKMEELMSEADPQADITMVLNCPECNNQWHSTFDILHYLWIEMDHWAKKLLRDVAALARAFGWSEREILDLSYNRRKMYLEMIGG